MNETAVDPNLRIAGLQRLGQGVAAEVFALPDGRVLKLMRDADAGAATEREAANMAAASRIGAPVPRLFGMVVVDGRPGILMERLNGPDQLTMLGRRPWKVWAAGKELARLHARLHSGPADPALRDIKETLRERLSESPRIPDDLRSFALESLDAVPDGTSLIHGDFHPGQVILTENGPRIIDWVNATRGDHLADVSRTVLLVGSATLPPGTSIVIRTLVGFARKVLLRSYLREYRRQLPFDDAALKAWEVPTAAERLADDAPAEREHLLALLRSRAHATDRL